MLSMFAAQDPQTILSSGNAAAILALIVVTLAGVVIYLTRKLDKQTTDNAAEIKELNKLIYNEQKEHTADYREMAKDNQEVLQGNSQSIQLMAAKIEAVKGRSE